LVALTENNEFIYWGIDEVEEFMKDDRKTSLYPKISFEKFFENKYQKSYKQVMVRIKGFSDSIAENGKYVKEFIEIKRLGKGSFRIQTKREEFLIEKPNSVMKKLKFSTDIEDLLKKLKIFFEIQRFQNERIAQCYSAWLENDYY
jgi:hypothetical protein